MFEKIAASLLSKFFGQYFDGLEGKNFDFSFISGEVKFQNLGLKKEALDQFELPITVKGGYLGELRLIIPWKNLKSQAAELHLKGVYLLAGPKESSEEDIGKKVSTTKQRLLQLADLIKTENEEKEEEGFLKKNLANILNNMQVFINNVHLSYVDSAEPFFNFGLTLESLHAYSTDKDWKKAFQSQSQTYGTFFKNVSVKNLAIYAKRGNVSENLETLIYKDSNPLDLTYILRPINLNLQIKIVKSETIQFDQPKIEINCVCERIAFVLNEFQYRDILYLLEFFNRYKNSINYIHLRPKCKVQDDPLKWWQFAYNCSVVRYRDRKKTFNWNYIKQFQEDQKKYIRIYTERKFSIGKPQITVNAELTEMAEIEAKYSVENILTFRALASAFIQKNKEIQQQREKFVQSNPILAKNKVKNYFSKVFDKANNSNLGLYLSLTTDIMKELQRSLSDNTSSSQIIIPSDYIQYLFSFKLNHCSFTLEARHSIKIVESSLVDFGVDIKVRANNSASFLGTIRNFHVTDYFTRKKKLEVVSPVTLINSQEDVFRLYFEIAPLNEKLDYKLKVDMIPINIIISHTLLYHIFVYFSKPLASKQSLRDLEIAAYLKLKKLKENTEKQLKGILKKQPTFGIDVNIQAPIIFIPENPRLYYSSRTLKLILGSLRITSSDPNIESPGLYTSYELKISEISALAGTLNFQTMAFEQIGLPMIENFQVLSDIKLCKISSSKPMAKLCITLPPLYVNLSSAKIADIISIINRVVQYSEIDASSISMKALDSILANEEHKPIQKGLQKQLNLSLTIESVNIFLLNIDQDKVTENDSYQLLKDYFLMMKCTSLNSKLNLTNQSLVLSTTLQSATVIAKNDDNNLTTILASEYIPSKSCSLQTLEIISSKEKQNFLISLKYVNTPKDSILYNETKSIHDIDLQLNVLHSIFNIQAIEKLVEFARVISDKVKTPPDPDSYKSLEFSCDEEDEAVPSVEDFPDLIVFDDLSTLVPKEREQKLVKFTATLTLFVVTIPWNNFPFLESYVHKSNCQLNLSNYFKMEMEGDLGSVIVDYLIEPANQFYPHIIEMEEGDKLIHFSASYFPSTENANQSRKITILPSDIQIGIEIFSIRLVYLQQVVYNILSFVLAKKEVTKVAIKQAEKMQVIILKMGLSIVINNPCIIIPESCESKTCLVANLGKISVSNQFSVENENEIELNNEENAIYVTKERFFIDVEDFHLITGNIEENFDDFWAIVPPFKISLVIARSLDNEESIVTVDVNIQSLAVYILQEHILLILSILSDNICDLITKPDIWKKMPELIELQPLEERKSSPSCDLNARAIAINTINVSNLTVVLYKSNKMGNIKDKKETIELLRTDCNLAKINIGVLENQIILVNVELKSFIVQDTNKKVDDQFLSICSPIISGSSTDLRSSQVVVHAQIYPSGRKVASIFIDYPKILIIPDICMNICSFFIPLYPKIDNVSHLLDTYIKFCTKNNVPDESPEKEILLVITNPEIYIVDNWDSKTSPAYVIKSTIDFTIQIDELNKTEKILLKVYQTEVYKCQMHRIESTLTTVVGPYNMNLSVLRNLLQNETICDCKIELIDVTVSLRDIEHVRQLINIWKPEINNLLESNVLNQIQLPALSDIHPSEKFNISSKGARIVLINDLGSNLYPLILFQLYSTEVHLANWSTLFNCYFESEFSLDYYNKNLEIFEPMLEPFNIFTSINKTIENIQISFTNKKINLNISKSFIESALNTVKAFDEYFNMQEIIDGAELITPSSPQQPYYIYNDTDIPIYYSTSSLKILRSLPPNSGEPLLHAPTTSQDYQWWHRIQEVHQQTISIHGNDPNGIYNAIDYNLPIDKLGSYKLALSSNRVHDNATFEVSIRAGRKYLTVRSNVLVENCCKINVELLIDSFQQNSILKQILSGSIISIPLTYTEKGELNLSPSIPTHQFTNLGISINNFPKENKIILEAKPTAEAKNKFYFMITLDRQIHDKIFKIHPPVILENTLPLPLDIKILSASGGYVGDFSIGKGVSSPIHFMNPLEKGQYIFFSLPNYSQCNQVVIANDTSRTETVINFRDAKKRPLQIKMVNKITNFGVRKLIIYCEYWLINNTNLPALLIKNANNNTICSGQINIENFIENNTEQKSKLLNNNNNIYNNIINNNNNDNENNENNNNILLFSNEKNQPISAKIMNSNWSLPFTFAEGSNKEVQIIDNIIPNNNQNNNKEYPLIYQIGVYVEAAIQQFWRTKILYFSDRFILINQTDEDLICRQFNYHFHQFNIEKNSSAPFHCFEASKSDDNLKLSINFASNKYLWSNPFQINLIGTSSLKLRNKNLVSYSIVKVHVKMEKAAIVVIFTVENDFPEYLIQNNTKYNIIFAQKGCADTDNIMMQTTQPYAFDDLFSPEKILTMQIQFLLESHEIDVKSFKEFSPISLKQKNEKLQVKISPKGPIKVISINEIIPKKNQRKNVNEISLKNSSEEEINLEDNHDDSIRLLFTLVCDEISISVIDDKPQELILMTILNMDVTLANSERKQVLDFKIRSLQIDNQLPVTPFPVLFRSIIPANRIFFLLKASKNKFPKSVNYFEYFYVSCGEIDFKMDKELLFKLFGFYSVISKQKINPEVVRRSLIDSYNGITKSGNIEKMVYFKVLRIEPFKLNVSFNVYSSPDTEDEISETLPIYLKVFLHINNATSISLNGFELHHPFCSQNELTTRIGAHYITSILTNMYSILGSADILGSPVSLLNNLGSGLYEITTSFSVVSGLKTILIAITDSTSKITGSLGSAITAISFDDEYQRERERNFALEKPMFASEGVVQSVKLLWNGFKSGIFGVVNEPMKGLSSGSTSGLIQGVAKATTGIIAKPISASLDSVSKVSEGVKNAFIAERITNRMRPPRCIGADRIIRIYNEKQSFSQHILHTIEKGKYENEWLQDSFDIKNGVLIVSDKRIISVIIYYGTQKLQWQIAISQIAGLQLTQSKIFISVKKQTTSDDFCIYPPSPSPLFGRSELNDIYHKLILSLQILKKQFRI